MKDELEDALSWMSLASAESMDMVEDVKKEMKCNMREYSNFVSCNQ